MEQNSGFYDRIAKKYGTYGTSSNSVLKKYPEGNPEHIFKRALLDHSGKRRIALDLGCGDGRFTLIIANHFKKIFCVDTSKILLAKAAELQRKKGALNVTFEHQDAASVIYPDAFFDVVYSRRGPVPFQEIQRILRPGGFYIGIEIAELDCREIKETFGRGQNYREWEGIPRKEKNAIVLNDLGFKVLRASEYFFIEYYLDYSGLANFLKMVPIFEDFDPYKDRRRLSKYVNDNTTNKGVKLVRHKLVTVAQKLRHTT